MTNIKVILFDGDGVLIRPPQLFSYIYESQHGLAPGSLQPFFDDKFHATSLGKADLKKLIVQRNNLWQWPGDPDELLEQWFAAENHPDQTMVEIVRSERQRGARVCLVTNQEKYRANYLRDVMFPGVFDDIFISCELGCLKSNPHFFELVLNRLKTDDTKLVPPQIIYFDNDQEAIDSAASIGVDAHLYKNAGQVRKLLA